RCRSPPRSSHGLVVLPHRFRSATSSSSRYFWRRRTRVPGDNRNDRSLLGLLNRWRRTLAGKILEHLSRTLWPITRMLRQTSRDRLFPILGNRIVPRDLQHFPAIVHRRRNPLLHLRKNVPLIERRATSEQLVQRCPKRIDVIARRGILAKCLLRTHVRRRTRPVVAHGTARQCLGNTRRHTKVRDLQPALAVKHQVTWLKVAMHNARLMVSVIQRSAKLFDVRQ